MKRVTGIGGVFFKCKDPVATRAWYKKHLGLDTDDYGTCFEWGGEHSGHTQWSPFKADTKYFAPSEQPYMINYRVEDLTWLIATLKEEGVTVLDEIAVYDYGKFAHILDLDGNKIELWEPNNEEFKKIVGGVTK